MPGGAPLGLTGCPGALPLTPTGRTPAGMPDLGPVDDVPVVLFPLRNSSEHTIFASSSSVSSFYRVSAYLVPFNLSCKALDLSLYCLDLGSLHSVKISDSRASTI